jgi:hypothetical protein
LPMSGTGGQAAYTRWPILMLFSWAAYFWAW